MRWKTLLPLALVLSALLPACGSSTTRSVGVLRLPLLRSSTIPDPALAVTPSQMFLTSLLYSGLVRFGPDLHVIPDLAVSIPTISGDGSRYTFTVRRDARFADGTRCTARDVADSIARALGPGLHAPLARRYLGEIRGARAVERGRKSKLSGIKILHRLTLRIRLTRPDANFLQKLAFPVSFVVESTAPRRRPVSPFAGAGTGPWALRSRAKDGSLTLAPRRHYYGGPLQLRALQLVRTASHDAALNLYRHGAIDAVFITPSSYGAWSTRPDFHSVAGLTGYYLIPAAQPPQSWENLNRVRLLQGFSGSLLPLSSIVPPAVPDYVPLTPNGDGGGRAGPARVQIGDRTDPVGQKLHEALMRLVRHGKRRDPPAVLVRRTYLLPVPSVWLSMPLASTPPAWYGRDISGAAGLTNDPVHRMDTYSTLERWALKHRLIIPLANAAVAYAVKPSVSGLQVTPLGLMPDNGTWNTVQVS